MTKLIKLTGEFWLSLLWNSSSLKLLQCRTKCYCLQSKFWHVLCGSITSVGICRHETNAEKANQNKKLICKIYGVSFLCSFFAMWRTSSSTWIIGENPNIFLEKLSQLIVTISRCSMAVFRLQEGIPFSSTRCFFGFSSSTNDGFKRPKPISPYKAHWKGNVFWGS